MSSSDAPNEFRPNSWENCAKEGFASNGIWPSSSWQQSLYKKNQRMVLTEVTKNFKFSGTNYAYTKRIGQIL